MRTMKLQHKKHGTIYESVFDEKTGALVRTIHKLDRFESIGDGDQYN